MQPRDGTPARADRPAPLTSQDLRRIVALLRRARRAAEAQQAEADRQQAERLSVGEGGNDAGRLEEGGRASDKQKAQS